MPRILLDEVSVAGNDFMAGFATNALVDGTNTVAVGGGVISGGANLLTNSGYSFTQDIQSSKHTRVEHN